MNIINMEGRVTYVRCLGWRGTLIWHIMCSADINRKYYTAYRPIATAITRRCLDRHFLLHEDMQVYSLDVLLHENESLH